MGTPPALVTGATTGQLIVGGGGGVTVTVESQDEDRPSESVVEQWNEVVPSAN